MTERRIFARLDELPSLPAAYHQVRVALDDPDLSLDAVAQAIESDPALTVRVLRVANSALYGLSTRVDTVLRALTIIGVAETRNLALATSVLLAFDGLPLGAISMRSFWEHSIGCGIAARLIATRVEADDPSYYYLLGLLHDIGRLPLLILEPALMNTALQAHRKQSNHLYLLEQSILGTDHAQLGAALMTHWQLPQRLIVPISNHHQPTCPSDSMRETAIVHIADVLANTLRIGTSGTRWVPFLNEASWDLCGLLPSDLPEIAQQTVTMTQDVASALLEF